MATSSPKVPPFPPLLITIDGPAGAGKTTISKLLAQRLAYRYIDTGALYRALAYRARQHNVDPGDDRMLAHMCRDVSLDLQTQPHGLQIVLNGEDITAGIRTPEISMLASAISAQPAIRAHLLAIQRRLGRNKRAVFEGRDMGTVVFPDADVKFFLTASEQIRTLRRFDELAERVSTTLEAVAAQIRQRDSNDSSRALAPLKAAGDAHHIDSSRLTPSEVVDRMVAAIEDTVASRHAPPSH